MANERDTILIVDDDEANRDVLSIILDQEGYNLEIAVDGREALEKIKQMPIDLVLLDLMMPIIDGYQVLRVMGGDDHMKDIPVIVITAVGKKESVKHCINMGATDYLLKPFDRDAVRSRVMAALAGTRLRKVEDDLKQKILVEKQRNDDVINMIVPASLALAGDGDFDQLLENFVLQSIQYCRADAGILYLRTRENRLRYEIICNIPLNIQMGGTTGKTPPYPPLHLSEAAVGPGEAFAVTEVAHSGLQMSFDINEMQGTSRFFSTRIFDEPEVFQALTFLITPLKTPLEEVVGVLELINAKEQVKNTVVPFPPHYCELINLMCNIAGMSIEVQQLRLRANRSSE